MRIYPPYWIVCGIVLLIYVFVLPSIITPGFIFSSITLYPHWPRLVSPSWTIAYEMFFYILFAMIWSAGNKFIKIFISVILTLFILFYNVSFTQISLDHLPYARNLLEFATSYVMIEFALGAFYALLLLRLVNKIPVRLTKYLIFTSCLMFFVMATTYRLYFVLINDARRLVFVAIPIAILIFSSALYESKIRIKLRPQIKLLSNASYSIFITHSLVLSVYFRIVQKIEIQNNIALFTSVLTGVCLAIFFGILFYVLIEKWLFRFPYKQQ